MAEPRIEIATPENCAAMAEADNGVMRTSFYGYCWNCCALCERTHIHIVDAAGIPAGACSEACAIQLMPREAVDV